MDSRVNIVIAGSVVRALRDHEKGKHGQPIIIMIAGSVVRALRDHEKGKHGQPSHYYDCRKCSESIKRPREG